MQREEQAILIAVFILFFLSIILIVLFVVFQKRKNVLLLDKKESAKRFKQEIAKTQIEIREETFRNISWRSVLISLIGLALPMLFYWAYTFIFEIPFVYSLPTYELIVPAFPSISNLTYHYICFLIRT